MKILALRLENLASLAGGVEIDFSKEPLASTGLFAITGPVGAGKSTLLDAICLALYEQTPRLRGRSRVQVGSAGDDERLGDRNVGSLVTRGRAHAFSEVDFCVRGGHRYRARWEIRRARGRPTGRFQNPTLRLTCLDTLEDLSGHGRTETLKAIERCVGLTFEQFCRSVLLAQGEFAAFLHGNAEERGALLEQMTGAHLYSRVSQVVHERARGVRSEVETLGRQIEQIRLLSPEERATLESTHQEIVREQAECARQAQTVAARRRWFDEMGRHEAEVREADHALEAALSSWNLLEAGTSPLHFPDLPSFFSEMDRLLEKASDLDGALHAAAEQARGAREEGESIRRAEAEARGEVQGATVQESNLLEQKAGHEAWFRDHESERFVAENWSHVRGALDRLVQARARWAELGQGIERLEARLGPARSTWARCQEEAASAREDLSQAEGPARECAQAAEGLSLDGVRARREALRERREAIQSLDRVVAEMERLQERKIRLEADAGAQEAVVLEAEEAARAALEARDRLASQWEAAHRSLRLLEQIQDLAQRRGHLVEGEPCPLCGSREHPFAGAAPPAPAADAQAQIVADLSTRRTRSDEERARQEERSRGARAVRDAMRAETRAVTAQMQACNAELESNAARLGLPAPLPPLESLKAASGDHQAQLQAQEVDVAREEAAIAGALASERQARERLDAARRRHDLTREREEKAAREVLALERELASIRLEAAHQRDVESGAIEDMDPHLGEAGSVRSALAEPEVARGRWEGIACDWTKRDEARRTLERDLLPAIGHRLAAARARLRALEESRARLEGELERRCAREEELRRERAALLSGQPVPQLRNRLDAMRRAESVRDERRRRKTEHAAAAPAETPEALAERAAQVTERLAELDQRRLDVMSRRQRDDADGAQRARLDSLRREQEAAGHDWLVLDDLIGSSDGKKFRNFAQGLTFRWVLERSNRHLADLMPRYVLSPVPGQDLEIQVEDQDMGGEIRSVNTLSGGETFLVSLALALGLSSLHAGDTPIESLFIDEGFGRLDGDTLEIALSVLDALQARGRQIGVISHVEGLAERIGVQVRLQRVGGGHSRVDVVGAAPAAPRETPEPSPLRA